MASLTDPYNTPAGTINSSNVTPTLPVAPSVGAGTPLTGNDTTAKIPDTTTPTTTPKPVVSAPTSTNVSATVPTPAPAPVNTTPSTTSMVADHSPVYDGSGKIVGYNVTYQDGTKSFQSSLAPTTTPSPAVNPGSAPEGATLSTNGNYITSDGTQYSKPPTSVALTQAQDAYQTEAAKASAAITNIQNGTTPLTPSEQAQIDGLKQQYEQMIADQKLTNIGASGIANVRGYQTGAAEYDPMFQIKTIGSIVTAGQNKVIDLQNKEASAIASLTQAFKTNDETAIKSAWDIYDSASTKRQDALQKVIDDTAKAIKDANDAKIAADKVTYDQVTKPIQDTIASVSKFNAPPEVMTALNQALKNGDLAGAISAAGSYAQDPTTTAGQYASYVRQATAAGQTPMSATAYLNKIAYSEAYSKAAGDAAGKASAAGTSTSTTILSSLDSATQAKLQASGFTKFNSGTQDLASQLVNGMIAPAELSKRTTGTSSYNDVLSAANAYSMAVKGEPFDIAKADRNYKFAVNTATQNTLNYLGSLVGSDNGSGLAGGNLDQLISQSNERVAIQAAKPQGLVIGGKGFSLFNTSSLPALNNVTQWAKLETGDPSMAAYHATLLEVSDQVAKILQGGGTGGGTSDAKLAQAVSLFNSGFTPDQMEAVATNLKELLASRAAGMVRDNPYLSDYAEQFGVKQVNGVTTTNTRLVADENAATAKLSAFQNQSAENKAIIDEIHTKYPEASATEVVTALNL